MYSYGFADHGVIIIITYEFAYHASCDVAGSTCMSHHCFDRLIMWEEAYRSRYRLDRPDYIWYHCILIIHSLNNWLFIPVQPGVERAEPMHTSAVLSGSFPYFDLLWFPPLVYLTMYSATVYSGNGFQLVQSVVL